MASYKLIFDDNGKTKTFTENHPKLNATAQDFSDAMEAIANSYDYTSKQVILTSDTTVWQVS